MVKHVEGWKLKKSIDQNHNVYVRSFSGAKVKCMKDYVKPCIREKNPDYVIFPQKKKYVRGNQSPFMNKKLSKAIMQRSKLRNLFLKKRTEENRNNYVKQRNLCVTLLRKSKR